MEALEHFSSLTAQSKKASSPLLGAKAQALCVQEHHCAGLKWGDAHFQAAARGWTLRGARAIPSSCGGRPSAGVGVLARAHVGMSKAGGKPVDRSPPSSPGRLAVTWLDCTLRGGLLVVSIYLWHSEGLSARNLELLAAAGQAVAEHGGAFVIAGDWNMTPAELGEAHHWLSKVGGHVVAPEVPTCRSTTGGRVIDFFVVDNRLRGGVIGVSTVLDLQTSPHSAVVLQLKASAPTQLFRTLAKPKAFPATRAPGCPRKPPPVDLDGFSDSVDGVDKTYSYLVGCAEVELCGLFDCHRPSGQPCSKYLGRGAEHRVKRIQAVPPSAKEDGIAPLEAQCLKLISLRLKEMMGMQASFARSGRLSAGQAVHWHQLQAMLRHPAGKLKRFLDKHDQCGTWRWRLWLASQLAPSDTHAMPGLKAWGAQAAQACKERSQIHKDAGARTWHRWIDEQLRAGAAALHRLTKRQVVVAPEPVTAEHGPGTMGLQAMVEAEAAAWRPVWEKFLARASAPWRSAPKGNPSWAQPLAPICAEQIVAVSKTYKEYTGLGIDSFHPRWFGWLSWDLLSGLAMLLNTLEAKGCWPSQIMHAIVALIPKPTGGTRPIGLLPALVRVWERIRKPDVAIWRRSVERPYNWAAKGRSPEDAVWRQALKAEAAQSRGEESGALLLDLVKAFEMVRLELVWYAGIKLRFHPVLLRLVLESCAFARHLVMNRAIAEPILSLSAVLAGGSFATDLLLIIMIEPCDKLLVEHPHVGLCLFVDDLTIDAQGSAEKIATVLPAAFRSCASLLEEGLTLSISRSKRRWVLDSKAKTVATASSRGLRQLLEPRFRAQGVATQKQSKLLGVDYNAGGTAPRHVWKSRLAKARSRREAYQRLGRKAALRLARTSAGPALSYGAGIYGTNDSGVRASRRFTCNVMGQSSGRCSFARLQLARYDPGAELATKPITDWAKAVWDEIVPPQDLSSAWRAAVPTVGLASRPFTKVCGPAGATTASLTRLGWKIPAFHTLLTERGELLDLTKVCPAVVTKHATAALEDVDRRSASTCWRINGVPELEPLADFIHGKKWKDSRQAESLRALGEGGWWPQARLHAEGVRGVQDGWCRACLTHDHCRLGDFRHRAVECPASAERRAGYKDQATLDRARSAVHAGEPLYSHGLPFRLPDPRVPTFQWRWCGGREPPDDFSFTGVCFTDGAMRHRNPVRARRAGWAAVLVDPNGLIIAGVYGPCAERFVSAGRAELTAIVRVLRMAIPPLTIYTDNQGVLDGIAKGPLWCCASSRPAADLWREFWRIIDDIGMAGLLFKKCKGHATQADVDAGRSTAFLRAGNDHADHYAGAGVDIALQQCPNYEHISQYKEATSWYKWLAHLADSLPRDTQLVQPRAVVEAGAAPARRPRRPTWRDWQPHAARPHALVEECGRIVCRACSRYASTNSSAACRRSLVVSPCEGPLAAKAAEANQRRQTGTGHHGHCLLRSGPVTWCNICGRYATKKVQALEAPCDGPPVGYGGREVSLRRLRASKHPKTSELLPPAVDV